jgi:hypothetical protein
MQEARYTSTVLKLIYRDTGLRPVPVMLENQVALPAIRLRTGQRPVSQLGPKTKQDTPPVRVHSCNSWQPLLRSSDAAFQHLVVQGH